jgi:hypothetical protein
VLAAATRVVEAGVDAAVFLASSDAAWITGETWLIAGGMR